MGGPKDIAAKCEVPVLAQQFLDATVNKWGTDEDVVYETVQAVHDCGVEQRFESYIVINTGSTVSAILKNEMSGSELARAEDLYQYGLDTHRASKLDYFVDGALSIFDFSSTTSKVVLGGTAVILGGLALISLPIATLAGSVLVLSIVIYSGISAVKDGVQILLAQHQQNEGAVKDHLRDLGQDLATVAITAPFLRSSFRNVRSNWCGFREMTRGVRLGRMVKLVEAGKQKFPTYDRIVDFQGGEKLPATINEAVLREKYPGQAILIEPRSGKILGTIPAVEVMDGDYQRGFLMLAAQNPGILKLEGKPLILVALSPYQGMFATYFKW